jgi:thiol-disulfide isomerase/thioredoxin
MAYLAAAVTLVGIIAAVDLLLTVGVVRRLREHSAELAGLRGPGAGDAGLPVGTPVGDFTATDLTGRPVGVGSGRTLVGFFSPGCGPCKERMPDFVAHAAGRPGGPGAVLAVVVGEAAEAAAMVDPLLRVATVVVEPEDGPVQRAFGVGGFPTFVLVEDGVVAAADFVLPPVTSRDTAVVPAAG